MIFALLVGSKEHKTSNTDPRDPGNKPSKQTGQEEGEGAEEKEDEGGVRRRRRRKRIEEREEEEE